MDDEREPGVQKGGQLSGGERGEGRRALELEEGGVGTIRGAQQSSALQPVDLAKLLVGPGEPGLELLVPFVTDIGEPGHCDEHAFLHQLVLTVPRFRAIRPTRAAGWDASRLSLLWLQVP